MKVGADDYLVSKGDLGRPAWRKLEETAKPLDDPAFAAARRQEAAEAEPDPDAIHATDLGLARLFAREYGDVVRFCPQLGKGGRWLIRTGGRLVPDETGEIYAKMETTVRGLYEAAAAATTKAERRELSAWARASEGRSRLDAGLVLASKRLAVHVRELDREAAVLNCRNGVVDLETGELRPHDPSDLFLKQIPHAYDPDAPCPRFLRFLDEIFADDEALIAYVQAALGYSLMGQPVEDCFFFAHGGGSNGKSVLINAVRGAMGPYAATVPFTSLLHDDRRGSAPRNDLAALRGARFVTATEPGEGQRFDEPTLKALTGRDVVSVRFLFAEHFDLEPEFVFWLSGNHKPQIRGVDDGIWRRVRLVPFTVKFWRRDDPDAPAEGPFRDDTLPDQLRAEAPGILAWLVRGAIRWRKDGLPLPPAVREATQDYRTEQDIVGQFLEERCDVDRTARTTSKALRDAYVAWCEANGDRPLEPRTFGRRLATHGLRAEKGTGGRREWVGVCLKTSEAVS